MGRYKCFACGEGGDVFTWVMKTQNMEFREALEYLAARAGVTLSKGPQSASEKSARSRYREAMEAAQRFFREQFEKHADARNYCTKRGLEKAVLDSWEIGYAPDVREALGGALKRNNVLLADAKELFLVDQDPSGGYRDKFWGRLMFPIRDERGDLVAFGGRILGDGHPKYINSSDTPLYRKSKVLYGLNRARDPITKAKHAVLVEGYLDVIACHRAGVEEAVASLGTALSEEQAKLLKRFCGEVVILYDSDAAGIKAAERAVTILQTEGLKVRVALMPDGEDPDTLLRSKGPEAVRAAVRGASGPAEFFVGRIEERHPNKDDVFWGEVVDVLRTSPNVIEIERQIERLVGRYAAVRDQASVKESLRRRVLGGRRHLRLNPAELAGTKVSSQLPPAEAAVFAALLDPDMRVAAWEALRNPQWIRSPLGQAARLDLLTALKECPTEDASNWMSRLGDDTQTRFFELQADPRFSGAAVDLGGAIRRLEREAAELEIVDRKTSAKSTQDISDILSALKRLKAPPESS